MNKNWIQLRDKFLMAYIEGVTQFLEKAKSHVNNFGKTRCPCKNCMNTVWESLDGVR